MGQKLRRGKCSSASGLRATADTTAAEALFGLGPKAAVGPPLGRIPLYLALRTCRCGVPTNAIGQDHRSNVKARSGARTTYNRACLLGENAMRFVLGLCLVIASCASANAAPSWHHKSRQAITRPGQAVTPSYITPGGVRIYRDDSVPGGLRTDHDDPPAYDDPSKFGGG